MSQFLRKHICPCFMNFIHYYRYFLFSNICWYWQANIVLKTISNFRSTKKSTDNIRFRSSPGYGSYVVRCWYCFDSLLSYRVLKCDGKHLESSEQCLFSPFWISPAIKPRNATEWWVKEKKKSGLYLMWESALQHTVSGYLTQITGAQLPQLGCDGILLHQCLLKGLKGTLW